MDKRNTEICTFDKKKPSINNLICKVPVSATYSLYKDGRIQKQINYQEISAALFTEFLAQKFGIDF